jgi:hypothetical protein
MTARRDGRFIGRGMREGTAYARGTTGARRPVYVNGTYCKSLAAGAKEAGKIANREVKTWEIRRLLDGQKVMLGVLVSETPPEKKSRPPAAPARKSLSPLIRYPSGEAPWEQGLPRRWR